MNINKENALERVAGLRRLAMIVEYEGTGYRGFQWQPGVPTIQDALEQALQKLTGEATRIAGAGRTDTGVHARGQVVSFVTTSGLTSETFVSAMNFHLPVDIAVRKAVEVPLEFDVRRDASRRRYRYTILNRDSPSPTLRRYSHQVRDVLDVAAMNMASKSLIGSHDFASFCGPLEDRDASTVRDVFEAEVTRDGDTVYLDMEANAFLTHQVRRTVGVLIEVGLGKKTVEEFVRLLGPGTPGTAGPKAPAKGLCLEKVTYTGLDLGGASCAEDPSAQYARS